MSLELSWSPRGNWAGPNTKISTTTQPVRPLQRIHFSLKLDGNRGDLTLHKVNLGAESKLLGYKLHKFYLNHKRQHVKRLPTLEACHIHDNSSAQRTPFCFPLSVFVVFVFFETESCCHPGQSTIARQRLTATSAFRVQAILPPHPPEQLGLQVSATMPS